MLLYKHVDQTLIRFDSVELLSRKGLQTSIESNEPVIQSPNRTEPRRFDSTKNLDFWAKTILNYQ